MAPGPLPTADRVRRNKPTIPTTKLPAAGRQGDPPEPPAHVTLGERGLDWWGWAWRTPQACAWDDGSLFTVARRALLEDVLAGADWSTPDGRGVLKEARELDDRLGLSPKGLAALRWSIVDEEPAAPASSGPAGGDRRARLQAV